MKYNIEEENIGIQYQVNEWFEINNMSDANNDDNNNNANDNMNIDNINIQINIYSYSNFLFL